MKKLSKAFCAGSMSLTFIFAGCSSGSSSSEVQKEEPIETICSALIDKEGYIPRLAVTTMYFDGDDLTSQLTNYYPDIESLKEEKLKEIHSPVEAINHNDGLIEVISEKKLSDLSKDPAKTNIDRKKAVLEGFLEAGEKQGTPHACDIPEGTIEDQKKQLKELQAKKDEASKKEESKTESSKPVNGIRPEFQKSMDDYLEFFREYTNFMKKYSETDGSDTEMLSDYMNFMSKYTQTLQSFEAMDDKDMTTEEMQLYIDTNAEIQKLLLEAAQ